MPALDRMPAFRRILASSVALLALVGPAVASPAHPTPHARLDTLAPAIAAWVAVALGRPLPPLLPAVVFSEPADLHAMRYGQAADASASAVLSVVALYDDATRTIHLPAGWSGDTPAELSILVHEMVHHFQHASGATFACPAEREAEAFDLQERWLARSGETLEGSFELDPLARLVLTHCGI
jgi:hypothetical protein